MELRFLQYVLSIAREQSIIRSAHSLHLSQPTLSTQIKNMKEELGKQAADSRHNGFFIMTAGLLVTASSLASFVFTEVLYDKLQSLSTLKPL